MDEDYHPPLILMGSDKGLLCLLDYKDNRVYLWNPAIREEFKALPSSPKAPREWKCTHSAYGFGYDPLTFDFKVVKISALDENGCGNLNSFKSCNKVGVYSLRSNSWKRLTMAVIFSELESDTGSSSSDMTTLLLC
ncbi:F-box associated interaction domain containing protein [Parasponia andersonii]|uniref:F-box associated interaction domain containing protein n=1 Tax=Parasponia andersonii TaxID=3476 RepID=A0A2P5DVN0_PARAD|nr:F-box associated interaction domain containing protein [Parasponia andersonii]